ncbi:MAG: PhzF family phenazine biosynthesis protein [Phycisphaerales bacterium]|jgi:PhzF family phenazine biosynthesis protein
MKIFHVDAFTASVFGGNPAVVVPIEQWPSEAVMKRVAAEQNLSETVFVGPASDDEADRRLRWFTPTVEVPLCGHATLAAAHVLWNHLDEVVERLTFESLSGPLTVWHEKQNDDDLIVMDFPARRTVACDGHAAIVEALGASPAELLRTTENIGVGDDAHPLYIAVYDTKRDVHELEPDMKKLAAIEAHGVIATAPGASHDFVSRFFAPRAGVDEDPVTGSAHCALAPYWAKRLGKSRLAARQVSKRGGELRCDVATTDQGERVLLAGKAVTYSVGEIIAPVGEPADVAEAVG